MTADHTVCFTGHRPKSIFSGNPYEESRRKDYQKIVDRIADFVCAMSENGYARFITGGAQGFDQLAFWAVNRVAKENRDIKNIVYIPFNGQERRWANKGLFGQNEYSLMLKCADEVRVCTETIDTGDFSKITKALMYRNRCMVNDSAYVLGQFEDDSWQHPKTKSGSADCLRYAKEKGRHIGLFNDCCRNLRDS